MSEMSAAQSSEFIDEQRTSPEAQSSLNKFGYWVGSYSDLFGPGKHGGMWPAFAASWDGLEADGFMADGGKYRSRRFSEFEYNVEASELRALPHRPFYQSKDLNKLNGGSDRHFAPITPFIAYHPIVIDMVKKYKHLFKEMTGVNMWHYYLHQVRITATKEMVGQPSPEGIHKDGVTFSTLFCVGRVGASGAANVIYDNEKTPLTQVILRHRGDCILMKDDSVYHYVTPMTVGEGSEIARRDMLFIEFIAQ